MPVTEKSNSKIEITSAQQSIDAEVLSLGEKLFGHIEDQVPSVFNSTYWEGRLLDWAMRDESFKVDLFRFVDVLPSLVTASQVSHHVNDYFLKEGRELPTFLKMAIKAASRNITSGLSAIVVRKGVSRLAERFIIGKDPSIALRVMEGLHPDGMLFTVDLLGESTVSFEEARLCQLRYLDLIDRLSHGVESWPSDDFQKMSYQGAIPVANVSLKISALDPLLDSLDPEGSVKRLMDIVLPVFLRAKERNVFVNLDMENWELHGITCDLFEELATHPELKNWPHIGVVVQAYLKDSAKDLERFINLSKSRGTPVTVRLVKGAYWDYEMVHAGQNGYPIHHFLSKGDTDANFEKLTAIALENIDHIYPAFGSHNHRSLLHAVALAKSMGIPENGFEIQMIYGMAEPEQVAFRKMGYRVRLYSPVGELLPGISYLVRRLLENTSNSGFLRMSYHEDVDRKGLLARPIPFNESSIVLKDDDSDNHFKNSPLTDFTDIASRSLFATAIEKAGNLLPIKVPVVVNGKERFKGEIAKLYSPGEHERQVSETTIPTIDEADEAVRTALASWPSWRDRNVEDRALLLEKLAERLEVERADIAAIEMFEVGKTWREADGDLAEAIDFCRYYAARARVELAPTKQGNIAGEENDLIHEGRGPTLVVAPWNFPAAILLGMTTAALVAGNSVIIKPSTKSTAVAYLIYKLMIEVGFPIDVVQFLPGGGETIGDHLVTHQLIAQIVFTGSREVGLLVIEKAAKVKEGQRQLKRVVCEMGGKNAIIVDDDADLDEAVHGVIASAFGYAGQKCSACSRVIVVGNITYKGFKDRLIEACRSLIIDKPWRPGSTLGPVIDKTAYDKLLSAIRFRGQGVRPQYIGKTKDAPEGGYYVPPALIEFDDENHKLMQEELFGPLLGIMKVDSFDRAIEAALSTEFALTGGVYSRNPTNIDKAKKSFRVGNLYFNRGITGAIVNRQPFGGFALSGFGTKAGGPGYLLNFSEARSISENSMRSGFTPDLTS